MKYPTMLPVPEPALADNSEDLVQREIAELGAWLAAQGFDSRTDHTHVEGSREQFYWRHGYFMGLKQGLAMLTGGGATMH